MYEAVKRYVTWTTSKTTGFTPSQKRQITMAHGELNRIAAAGLEPVRVPKRRGERMGPYRRRVAAIKRANGVAGSPLIAVPARVSRVERARIVGTRVVVTVVRGAGAPRRRRQWFMPFDPVLLTTPHGRRQEAERIWSHVVAQGGQRVRFAMGPRRKASDDFYVDLDDMAESLEDDAEMYGNNLGYAIVGVYISTT